MFDNLKFEILFSSRCLCLISVLYALIFLCFVPRPLPCRHIEAFVGLIGWTGVNLPWQDLHLLLVLTNLLHRDSSTLLVIELLRRPFEDVFHLAETNPSKGVPKISFKILQHLLFLRIRLLIDVEKLLMKMNIPCRSNSIQGPELARGNAHIDTAVN